MVVFVLYGCLYFGLRYGKDEITLASKKDKLIADAQKLALKGQVDKAIKAYEQVIALDPTSAVNQRQRLAELLIKAGRTNAARIQLENIGKHFANNGYYLKAIAVYKKLQMMFPSDITIVLFLAELNEKHGLLANALAEYKQVYDYYEQHGDTQESLKVLEKMHSADNTSVVVKLKLAEAYFQAGRKEDSYALFGRLALLLQEKNEDPRFEKQLHSRIKQLFPEKSDFALEVLAEQVHRGDESLLQNTAASLQSLLKTNPENKYVWQLIIEVYQRLNQPELIKLAYQHCIKFFPDDLSIQKGFVESLVAIGDFEVALREIDTFEPNFTNASALGELLGVYQSLDNISPMNLRVLQGLKRSYEALGASAKAIEIDRKIESLQSVSGAKQPKPDTPVIEEEPLAEDLLAVEESDVAFTDPEEIELEFDIDLGEDKDASLEPLSQDGAVYGAAGETWLDLVDTAFDSTVATRSVKFGDDVESLDAQTHYDLGVAFKEMGLFDEALNELRQAGEDNSFRLASLILQGACLREKGELKAAEELLRALLNPEFSGEDVRAVKYELALVYQNSGKDDAAAGLLKEIGAPNPKAIKEKLSLDFSDAELKGFDLK